MSSEDLRPGELRSSLAQHFPSLTPVQLDRFTDYYALVLKWNNRLHLTTLIEPAQFLERHIAEVCSAVDLIDKGVAKVWDLGSGLGVPGIPIKILRPELEVVLIESSRKKAIFLETVISELRLEHCVVACRRIEDLPLPSAEVLLTARAVEQMESLLPLIRQFALTACQALLFISQESGQRIMGATLYQLPGSRQRSIAVLKCST